MSKTYKGWELIKAMAEGEIKEGSKIVDKLYKEEYIYSRNEITNEPMLYKKDPVTEDYFIPDYSFFAEKDNDFELIEYEKDIDDIKELYINDGMKSVGKDTIKNWTGRSLDITFANKMNEILQALKQLNERVKKLEEKDVQILFR